MLWSLGLAVFIPGWSGCAENEPGPTAPPCVADCDGRVCGDDGCGASCGACADDQVCSPQGLCLGGEVCEGITLYGCCTGDGAVLKYCKNGEVQVLDCEGYRCGFREEAGVYACGDVADPSPDATKPFLCPGETCPPDTCANQACGFDCGQSCGECSAGQYCDGTQCQACSCQGKQCGQDPCGQSCGECTGDDTCDEASGQCVGNACGEVTFEGCCTGEGNLRFCDEGTLRTFGCGKKGTCGWRDNDFGFDCTTDGALPPAGTDFLCPGETCATDPPCADRECGNSCGVVCGSCAEGEFCDDFTGTCAACSCDGKNCGDDGCGTSCGTCSDGQVCDRDTQVCRADACGAVTSVGCCNADGSAVDCVNGALTQVACPEFGLTCGWNGINYGCAPYQAPSPELDQPYACPGEACATQCSDIECGFACGTFCGNCSEGYWCDGTTCKPCSCAGVECGSDGCGNPCGGCSSGDICDEFKGTCEKDGCGFTDYVGCCDGLTQYSCGWSGLSAVVCTNSCGWDANAEGYRCGGSGDDPTGAHPIACDFGDGS